MSLNPTTGALTLRFKCTNPEGVAGVVYNIKRRIGTGGFVSVANVGEKRYDDLTIPAGTSSITYTVQGQRGNTLGQVSTAIEVRFGAGGQMSVSTFDATTAKLAA